MAHPETDSERRLAARAVLKILHDTSTCEVRDDRLARALYATDASIYQIVPDAVVLPHNVEDVQAAVRACALHGVPITPRGAGTGLTGGCINRGIQLDHSRYLNRVLNIDVERRTATVQPGVVLDELNAQLKPHGLHFSPDVATANRATIGGMIGNNSAGAHSIVVGRTCDHVLGVDVVLADGSVASWGDGVEAQQTAFAQTCALTLRDVLQEHRAEIDRRFPKVFRRNGGYALDRLTEGDGRLNVEQVIVGSEGTLGIVVRATLNLLPLPKHQGLVVVHFADLMESLRAVPAILKHEPAAAELVDRLILDGSRDNPALARRRRFLDGDPEAVLAVEFFAEDAAELRGRLDALVADLNGQNIGYAWPVLIEPEQQADVWEVRKAGTGLLMSQPGDTQPYDFIDDCAVEPDKLHDYIARLRTILAEEGVERTGFYAHASVGLLHVRPALNLKRQDGVEKLRRIADRVASLVQEFEGAMTGEHGEGLVRSEWIERLFGLELVRAFRRVKRAFDPQGILNPGKIVDPQPMDINLRYGVEYRTQQPETVLDFSRYGGMVGLAEMCSGLGECRKRLVGTMCPSYVATGDESHTTRARANALREALANHELLVGLADPALDDVFDLCLACKACKTECPTATDVAKLKAEWLHHRNQRQGVPKRSRMIARSVSLAQWGCHFAPLSNWVLQSKAVRAVMEHLYGLDRRVPPPRFARTPFRTWFKRHVPAQQPTQSPVVFFVDTWVNFYTPEVGVATVKVLESLGYEVLVPPSVCCGRPLISKGLLDEARRLVEENVAVLGPYAESGVPIVGAEPSCISALTDELPQFVRTAAARRISEVARTVDSFVADALAAAPERLRFRDGQPPVLFHGHCHQKASSGTAAAMQVLAACTGSTAREIDSGCCGMAGAFGHEVEHYDVAKTIGEQRLFPAVRERGNAEIAVTGFSCRHHIEHHTGVQPRHLVEILADALEDGGGGAGDGRA